MSVLDEVRALGERALTEADELDSQARELITQAKALRAFARAAGIGVEPKPASTQPAGGRREVPGPVTQRKVAGAIGEHAAWLNGEPFTIAEVTGAAGLSAMSPVRAVMEHWRERGITGRAGMRGHSHLYRVLNPSAVMKVVNDDA